MKLAHPRQTFGHSKNEPPHCVFITGPSGAGKTTLMRSAATWLEDAGAFIGVPRKASSRKLRDEQEASELECLAVEEIERRAARNEYLVRYESYGAHYALPRDPFLDPQGGTILLQTLPTYVAARLREMLEPRWRVHICLLEADAETIRKRLLLRADQATLDRLDERSCNASGQYHPLADIVLNATAGEAEVFAVFCRWLEPRLRRTHTDAPTPPPAAASTTRAALLG